MLTFVTIVHVFLCVFMIFVILLQPGKDAGMGAALGGGAATSAFGGRGAVTFLSRATAVCAGLFFVTSLGLSFVGVHSSVAAGGDDGTAKAARKTPGKSPAAAPSTEAGDGGVVSDAVESKPSPVPVVPVQPDGGTSRKKRAPGAR